VLLSLLMLGIAGSAFSQSPVDKVVTEKRAQTGMKFLAFSVDARAAALANAATVDMSSGAVGLFYNPATVGWQDKTFSVAAGRTQWIADINYNAFAVSYQPGKGEYGVFGVSFMNVDAGEIIGTALDASERGFRFTNSYTPTAWVLGIGYSKKLSDKFSFGAQAKYVSENLATALISTTNGDEYKKYEESTFAADFGIIYRTGFKSLALGMAARNFAPEVKYEEENFELPLTFRIGVSMDLLDFTTRDPDRHSLMLRVDTERPRDFSEQVKVGAEYVFMNLFSLRAGYVTPTDEEGISLGGGLHKNFDTFGFMLDYSYTSFGVFDNVNRFTAKFSF
jgi:hypothetical protein